MREEDGREVTEAARCGKAALTRSGKGAGNAAIAGKGPGENGDPTAKWRGGTCREQGLLR